MSFRPRTPESYVRWALFGPSNLKLPPMRNNVRAVRNSHKKEPCEICGEPQRRGTQMKKHKRVEHGV